MSPWLGYAMVTALAGGLVRVWVRYKYDRRARRAYNAPLFDPFQLDVALTPRDSDGDDENVLAEMKQTLAHLNRQAYAQEFWTLHQQLAAYYNKIPKAACPTMRRALVRLLSADSGWLQIAAAKTCAAIGISEAIVPLRDLVTAPKSADDADKRFRQELQSSLNALESHSPQATPAE